jgi:hypothetical protein
VRKNWSFTGTHSFITGTILRFCIVLFLCVSGDAHGAEITAINPTYLGGPQRNYYGDRAPNRLDIIWKLDLGSGRTQLRDKTPLWKGAGWTGQPLIIREGTEKYLVLGAYDHHLRKIRASDGKVIWKYAFDDVIKGTSTFWENTKAKSEEERFVIIQGSRMGIKIPAASCGVFRRGEVVRSPQAAGNQTLRD